MSTLKNNVPLYKCSSYMKIEETQLIDLKKLENSGLLISYKTLNNRNIKLTDLVGKYIDELDLTLLSIISYHDEECEKLMDWIYYSLADSKKKRAKCKEYSHATARSERLIVWKLIMGINKTVRKNNYKKSLDHICNILIKSNDELERNFSFESEFSNLYVMKYRDNYSMQLVRAVEIFLDNSTLKSHIELFKSSYGVELKDYIYIVYYIVNRFATFEKIDYFQPYNINRWRLNIDNIKLKNINESTLKAVLDSISDDMESYHNNLLSSKTSIRDFSLFYRKPLLKLNSNSYIPLDGKLLEDLLFTNLYYKIAEASNKNAFMSDFGFSFESYVCKLVSECCSHRRIYSYIPEFEYKHEKNNKKSHDAIIYNESTNSTLLIEVKSSKFLHSMLTTDDNNESFNSTVDKLMLTPWNQMMKSLDGIMKSNAEPRFNEKTKFFFLCVTMNDIPMYPLNIKIEQEGRDITEFFYSMNIESFEIFTEILSAESEYCFGSVLLGFLKHNKVMSMKTYLARVRDRNKLYNSEFTRNIHKNTINFISNIST